MNYIPIGIMPDADAMPVMEASDFSDKNYDGIQLRGSKKDNIVLIMHSKKTSPMEWKVAYGFSQIFFRSFEEAVAFCERYGMRPLEGGR